MIIVGIALCAVFLLLWTGHVHTSGYQLGVRHGRLLAADERAAAAHAELPS